MMDNENTSDSINNEVEVDIFESSVPPLEKVPPPPLPKLTPKKRKLEDIERENENENENKEEEGKKKQKNKKKKKKKKKVNHQPPKKKRKFSNQNALDPLEKQKRTIKITNIPFDGDNKLSYYEKKFKSIFVKFGEIASVRFRNIPIKKPDHLKYTKIPVFVCVRKGYFAKRGVMICFLVFNDEESAIKSLSMNESHFEGHTIFVERVAMKKRKNRFEEEEEEESEEIDNRKVFVGNIPFELELQELIDLLKKKETAVGGKIENIVMPLDKPKRDVYGNFLSTGSRNRLEEKTQRLIDNMSTSKTSGEVKFRNKGFAIITFENEECVENVFRKRINVNYKGRHFKFRKYTSNKRKKEIKKKMKKMKKKMSNNRRRGNDEEEEEEEEGEEEKKKKKDGEWWKGEESKVGTSNILSKSKKKEKEKKINWNSTTGTVISQQSKKRKRRKRKRK